MGTWSPADLKTLPQWTIDFMPFAESITVMLAHTSPQQKAAARANTLRVKVACAHRASRPVKESRWADAEPSSISLFFPCAVQSPVPSLTRVCRSFWETMRKERGEGGGREREKEKEWGLRAKPSPETPLHCRHRESRKSEVKEQKKWQRLVSLD